MATLPLTAAPALDAGSPGDRSAFRRIAAFLTLSVILGALGGAITGEKTTFLLAGFVFIPFLPAWAKSREPLGAAASALS